MSPPVESIELDMWRSFIRSLSSSTFGPPFRPVLRRLVRVVAEQKSLPAFGKVGVALGHCPPLPAQLLAQPVQVLGKARDVEVPRQLFGAVELIGDHGEMPLDGVRREQGHANVPFGGGRRVSAGGT